MSSHFPKKQWTVWETVLRLERQTEIRGVSERCGVRRWGVNGQKNADTEGYRETERERQEHQVSQSPALSDLLPPDTSPDSLVANLNTALSYSLDSLPPSPLALYSDLSLTSPPTATSWKPIGAAPQLAATRTYDILPGGTLWVQNQLLLYPHSETTPEHFSPPLIICSTTLLPLPLLRTK